MSITGISAISGEQIIAAGAVSAREAASAAFTTGGNSLQGLYDTVSNNSGSWTGGSTYTGDAQGALDEVYSNSANWNSTYTTVSDNSASWTGGAGGGLPMNIGDSAVFDSGYAMDSTSMPALYLSGNMYNYPAIQVRGGYNTEGESGTIYSNFVAFHTGYTNSTYRKQVLRLDRFGLTGDAEYNGGSWYFRPYEYGLLTGTYDTVSNNSAGWNDTRNTYLDFAQANSYENPGWETAGITTANPFGFKINPSVAYDDVLIVASRLITRKVYGPWYELDLSFAFSGNPKSQYGYYSNFASLDSGHFACPFTAQSQDDWNNVGGNMSYIGIWGNAANYTTFDPYNKTATQVINLKTRVLNS